MFNRVGLVKRLESITLFLFTRTKQDSIFQAFLVFNAASLVLAVCLIFLFLAKEGIFNFSGDVKSLFFDQSWYPLEGQYNLMPMLVGSGLVAFGAVLFAFPLGLFSAIFANFYCGSVSSWVFKRSIELYTGIPSVIFGFWGLVKIVPLINDITPPGQSLLAGVVVLSLMIFPILTLNLISSFDTASRQFYSVSKSLGIRKSTYLWKILIPNVRNQMVGSIVLSFGRAIGETMAVLMVCGNIVQIPDSVYEPIRTLTANIALEMGYAMESHRSALFISGFLLLVVVSLLFLLSDLVKGNGTSNI